MTQVTELVSLVRGLFLARGFNGRKASRKQAKRPTNRFARFEPLEQRQLLAVSVAPQPWVVPAVADDFTVQLGGYAARPFPDESFEGLRAKVSTSLRNTVAEVDGLALFTQPSSNGALCAVADLVEVWGDLKPGGSGPDTYLGRFDIPSDAHSDVLYIDGDLLERSVIVSRSFTPTLFYNVHLRPELDSTDFGRFQLSTVVDLATLNGREVDPERVGVVGTAPTHLIQRPVDLSVTVTDTDAQWQAGQADVSFGQVNYAAKEKVLVHSQYVMVRGNGPNGATKIANTIGNLHMQNTGTGQSVPLDPLMWDQTTGSYIDEWGSEWGFQVYAANTKSGFVANGTWEVLGDLTGAVNGDQFQMSMVTDLDGSENLPFADPRQFDIYARTQTGKAVHVMQDGLVEGWWHDVQQVSTLFVTELSGPATDTVVANQKNVTAVRCGAYADQSDLLVTRVVVTAAEGDLRNGQNWSLWADTDGDNAVDTIVDRGKSASGSQQVTFNTIVNGGYVVPNGQNVRFEAHFDAANSFMTSTMRAEVAGLEAERTDNGASVNWTITHAPQTLWSFVQQGDLWVTQDVVPVRSHQLLGGTLADPVMRLAFHAENEDIDVTTIHLYVLSGQARSVDRLELFKEGATTPFAIATIGGTGSDYVPAGYDAFTVSMQSQQFVIPKGDDRKVIVRPRMKDDNAGAVSGDTFSLVVLPDPVIDNSTGEGAIHARGVNSSNNIAGNDGDGVAEGEVHLGTTGLGPNVEFASPQHTVVCSKVVALTNANPDANGTAVPTGVANIGQFKFSAMPNMNNKNGLNKVGLSDVVFTVMSANVEMDASSFMFFNKANSMLLCSASSLWTLDGQSQISGIATGNFLVKFDNLTASAVDVFIDQNSDETFVLQARITNPKVNAALTSSLQVSIDRFTDPNANGFGVAPTCSHLRWKDIDTTLAEVFNWIDFPETLVRSTLYQS